MQEEKVKFGNCNGLVSIGSDKGILFYSGFFGNKDESHNLFGEYAGILQGKGYSTLRYDATGIQDKCLDGVLVSQWAKDSLDALEFFQDAGMKQIGVVGFSLGAAYAVLNYQKANLTAMALWAPAFDPGQDMLARYKKNGYYNKAENNRLVKYGNKLSQMLDSLDFDVWDELRLISCPVFIAHSEQDQYIPVKTSWKAAGVFRNMQNFLRLRNCSHSFRTCSGDKRNYLYQMTSYFFLRHL